MAKPRAVFTFVLSVTLLTGVAPTTYRAQVNRQSAESVDPRKVLAAHLSHGIGENPLDSSLVKDKTNARLLIAARNGAEYAQLLDLVSPRQVLDERLEALGKARLITRRADRIRTAFPILIGEQRKEYNRLIVQAAREIYPKLLPNVRSLLHELRRRGWEAWSYHFVWSQVFDSQFIWTEMIERGFSPPLTPVLVWVVYPSHPFKSGTNYYPDDELRNDLLVVSWSPIGANTLGLIGGNWRTVYPSALAGKPIDDDAVTQLRRLGLLGKQNQVLIPVVKRTDPLYHRLQQTAQSYVERLRRHLHVQKLTAIMDIDEKYAWDVAYHDLSWELIKLMVDRGEFKRPAALGPQHDKGDAPSMIGACAVIEAYPPFVKMIEKALQGN